MDAADAEARVIACKICGRSLDTIAARSGHMPAHRNGSKGGLKLEGRCPGSGMTMVPRRYTIRQIEPEDRARYERFVQAATDRGDLDEAEGYRQSIAEWEKQQGQESERLACPVCGDTLLVPTSRGTSRPHRRSGLDQPSWERVRQLRKEIEILQSELNRVLDALEP